MKKTFIISLALLLNTLVFWGIAAARTVQIPDTVTIPIGFKGYLATVVKIKALDCGFDSTAGDLDKIAHCNNARKEKLVNMMKALIEEFNCTTSTMNIFDPSYDVEKSHDYTDYITTDFIDDYTGGIKETIAMISDWNLVECKKNPFAEIKGVKGDSAIVPSTRESMEGIAETCFKEECNVVFSNSRRNIIGKIDFTPKYIFPFLLERPTDPSAAVPDK